MYSRLSILILVVSFVLNESQAQNCNIVGGCKNGGTCSYWQNVAYLSTCICPSGFGGFACQISLTGNPTTTTAIPSGSNVVTFVSCDAGQPPCPTGMVSI